MSPTVLSAPRAEQTVVEPPLLTITVQITVRGEQLPPAAARLISDLEALVQSAPTAPAPAPVLRLVDSTPKVRRIGRPAEGGPSLYLSTGSRMLLRDGEKVPLTRREHDLLQFLCEHPRRVFSRSQLLHQVWGYEMVSTERTVDVHVRRLRAKLGDCASLISTVRGVGYRLDDDTPVSVVVQPD